MTAQETRVSNTTQILFTRGVPAVEALPNTLIAECLQAVLNGPDGRTILQYGHNGGYLPLRRMLAEQYAVTEDQILIGNGSLHLQDLLAAMLVQLGDVALVEEPGYDRAIKTFRRSGAKVFGVPLEADGINLAALEKAVQLRVPAFLYLIPDFQNPSGITMSYEKRQAVVEMAERYGFWLIEDVPYRPLRYSGTSLPLLRSFSPRRVFTISSFSKLIAPALRVGYLIGPTSIVEQIKELAEDTILTPVLPTQAAVLEFYKRGYYASNLEHLKQLYAPRLQAIVAALKRYLPDIPFAEPEGGFFVSITLPEQVNCTNLLQRARQHGLVLTDGRGFFARPLDEQQSNKNLGERFVRLPFCALEPAEIDAGIQRLAEVIR